MGVSSSNAAMLIRMWLPPAWGWNFNCWIRQKQVTAASMLNIYSRQCSGTLWPKMVVSSPSEIMLTPCQVFWEEASRKRSSMFKGIFPPSSHHSKESWLIRFILNSFVFRLYDLNGDNILTMDEISRIFFAVYRLLGDNVNQKHDQMTYETQAENLYKKIDHNRTGVITREQFMEYCMMDSTIVDTIKALEMSICSSAWKTDCSL